MSVYRSNQLCSALKLKQSNDVLQPLIRLQMTCNYLDTDTRLHFLLYCLPHTSLLEGTKIDTLSPYLYVTITAWHIGLFAQNIAFQDARTIGFFFSIVEKLILIYENRRCFISSVYLHEG
jgi:hypothetical protein